MSVIAYVLRSVTLCLWRRGQKVIVLWNRLGSYLHILLGTSGACLCRILLSALTLLALKGRWAPKIAGETLWLTRFPVLLQAVRLPTPFRQVERNVRLTLAVAKLVVRRCSA